MKSLNKPITLVEAQSIWNVLISSGSSKIGLANILFLFICVKMIMTFKMTQRHFYAMASLGLYDTLSMNVVSQIRHFQSMHGLTLVTNTKYPHIYLITKVNLVVLSSI